MTFLHDSVLNSPVIYSPPTEVSKDRKEDHSQDIIVVVTLHGNVYLVDPGTGSQSLLYQISSLVLGSPAVGTDGTIYVGADDKNLYAIDQKGSVKWMYATGGIIVASPLVSEDDHRDTIISFASEDHQVYAVTEDGKKVWQGTAGGKIDSSPTVGTDQVKDMKGIWTASFDLNLNLFSNLDGTQLRSYPLPCPGGGIPESSPVGAFLVDVLFACGNNLYAFDTSSQLNAPKWTANIGPVGLSVPAVDDNRSAIYVGSTDGNVYAVSSKDGSPLWPPFKTQNGISSSPAVGSDGTIYVGSGDSNVYAINPKDGTAKWSAPFKTGGPVQSSPAIGADGTIYIGDDKGNFYAIQ